MTRAPVAIVRLLPPAWTPCAVDDIVCVLNPVQRADLTVILGMTPPARCLAVAMAYAGIASYETLLGQAQLMDPRKGHRRETAAPQSLRRWLTGETRMPLGAAYRLAAVFGQPIDLLFSREADQC